MTDIFTEYDDTIAAEVLRDPLGLQVIWSDLGQRIFQYRLTSISNDIRNFSINLFHHNTIRDLFKQNKLTLSEKQKKHFRNDSVLKMGLVLFLENLMVYSLFDLNERGDENASLEGLLGSLNARTQWKTENRNPMISTSSEHELLVRQISLGINGRYKTPFMQMGIINRDYSYSLDNDIWKDIERLFSDSNKWSKRVNELKLVLEDIVSKACRVSSSAPNIELPYKRCLEIASNRRTNLRNLYRDVFGNTSIIPPKVKKFLMNQMGLNEGAARALYAALTKNAANMNDRNYQAIFSASLHEEMTAEQKKLIEDIVQVEPHLSRLSYVFDRICIPETYAVDDVQQYVNALLKISSNERKYIEDIRSRIAQGTTTSSERLRKITKVLKSKDSKTFVMGLHEYHQEVMDFRNLPAWFSLRGVQISHGTKTNVRMEDSYDFHHPRWIHDYYLNTLISLHRGIGKA